MAIVDNFTKEELEQIVKDSYSYRDVITKVGYTTVTGNNIKTVRNRIEKYNIDTSHFSIAGIRGITRTEENVFCSDSTATQSTLRRWFIKGEYVPYQCDCCGISEWQNKKLTLQLDHKNGDNHDNRLENLRWLCPNCHSQTDTFCGKHIKKKHITANGIIAEIPKKYCIDCGREITRLATRCPKCAQIASRSIERPSKEELYLFLIELNGNFTEAGRHYNTTDNNVRKWCKQYDLPYHSSDYKISPQIIKKQEDNNGKPKPVVRCDKDNLSELQSYDSMYDAAKWLQNNNYTSDKNTTSVSAHIGQVCKGKRKTAYGFKWQLKS